MVGHVELRGDCLGDGQHRRPDDREGGRRLSASAPVRVLGRVGHHICVVADMPRPEGEGHHVPCRYRALPRDQVFRFAGLPRLPARHPAGKLHLGRQCIGQHHPQSISRPGVAQYQREDHFAMIRHTRFRDNALAGRQHRHDDLNRGLRFVVARVLVRCRTRNGRSIGEHARRQGPAQRACDRNDASLVRPNIVHHPGVGHASDRGHGRPAAGIAHLRQANRHHVRDDHAPRHRRSRIRVL